MIGSTSVIMPEIRLAEESAVVVFSFINHVSDLCGINTGIPFKKIKNRSRNNWEIENDLKNQL